jgi:hypothetical protein
VLRCNDNAHSLDEFGTEAPWPKKKVGTVRYIDCELVARYAPRQLRVVAGLPSRLERVIAEMT